jgi:glycosyltransferase involved in cell wall biosynthesis
MPFSVVIIAANQARVIAKCVQAARLISNDVLVIVNNSSDDTAGLAKNAGARVVEHHWLGYGATKNYAHTLAIHDWILSIDADEYIDSTLQQSLTQANLTNKSYVYTVTRKLLWRNKLLHFGVAKETKARLFHRQFAQWNNDVVHEELLFEQEAKFIALDGTLIHDSYANKIDAQARLEKYAQLMAKKRLQQGKSKSILPPSVHGAVNFLIQLFVRGAILDGARGIEFAWLMADYTRKKYAYLANNYLATP